MAVIPKRCANKFCERLGSTANHAHSNTIFMQWPIERVVSDPKCLKLVTSVCKQQILALVRHLLMGAWAFVASRLYTIGRKIACFTVLIADWFTRTSVAARAVCGTGKPLAKLVA